MSARAEPEAPSFCLVDQHGQAVSEQSYLGQYTLWFFGFTHCRVVCPRALEGLSNALDRIGLKSTRFKPLYVTIDPERDTPDVMRDFLQKWPRFTGLTGNAAELLRVRQSFRVFCERLDEGSSDYQIAHTSFTYVVDPRGQFVDHWLAGSDVEQIAKLLRKFAGE